jgi:hypothetical protein
MRLVLVAAAVLLPAVAAAQTTVYSQNFESGAAGPQWSGVTTVQSTQGLSAFGFGAQHLKNDGNAPSLLTLGGLTAHTQMSLTFDLAMWDSIDMGSDIFQVFVDGTPLYNGTFGNYFPASGNCEGPGTPITPPFIDFSSPNYGYGFHRDCGMAVSFTFAHSAPSAVFSFAYPNTQGAPDESFGIDNVLVQTNARVTTATPEPATWATLGTGLLALVAFRRRQSTANSRADSLS